MPNYCSSIFNLSVIIRIVDTLCILSVPMKRHYAPDKRSLLAIEYNEDTIEVIEENDVDKVLDKAPDKTSRVETAA